MRTERVLAALVLLPALGAAAAEPAPDLPIREVTVFSDRARVVRRGALVASGGETRVRLPLLPPTLDPESVRVEAEGGSVLRVEVRRAQSGEFPRSEAEKLVRELEQARDLEGGLRERIGVLEAERDLLLALKPEAGPQPDPKAAPVLLETGGWRTGLAFVDARAGAANESLRGLEAQLRAAEKKTAQLAERAAQLQAGDNGTPGWLAEAVLGAKGPVRLALSYVAANARWRPAYDVRFSPGKGEVEVDFAGLVSQETGEDWADARLSLSTAVPATATAIPKLQSWKIGEREQFIPTPVAKPGQPPPPPPDLPRVETGGSEQAVEGLRQRLADLAPGGTRDEETKKGTKEPHKTPPEETEAMNINLGVGTQKVINVPGIARIAIGDPSIADVKPLGTTQLLVVGTEEGRSTLLIWKNDGTRRSYRVSVRKKDPNEVIEELRKLLGDREGITVRMIGDRVYLDGFAYTKEDAERVDKIVSLYPKVVSFVKTAPNAKVLRAQAGKDTFGQKAAATGGESGSFARSNPVPVENVRFGAPPGFLPGFASDLPAALAGGYDFVYPSARPESIKSGGEARRVVLHVARFPAASRLAVFPALSPKAYLVAEVTNSSDKPLLRGLANLFVGADLQGQATLDTTAVGEKVALPLGVDDAIQVQRQVNLVTRETGFISKDDVTTYEVSIELVNPRPGPVEARVVNQIPLKGDQTVEVELARSEPSAVQQKEGLLEWRLKLGPAAKQVLKFAYTVTRPRGAQLRQW